MTTKKITHKKAEEPAPEPKAKEGTATIERAEIVAYVESLKGNEGNYGGALRDILNWLRQRS
jgi:hypothetical protein